MSTTIKQSSTRESSTNRLAIVLIAGLANFVGLVPPLLMFGYPNLLLPLSIAIFVLGGGFYYLLAESERLATHKPNVLEYSLAGLGAIFGPAFIGILWIVFYWLVYGVVALLDWLVRSWLIDVPGVAIVITTIVAVPVASILLAVTITNMEDQLFPRTAGIKTAFYPMLTQNRRRLLTCSVLAIIVLTLALILYPLIRGAFDNWFYASLEIYLFFVTASLYTATVVADKPRYGDDIVEMVADLFAKVGYHVELQPRTLDEKVDPLLVNLDFMAQSNGHTIFARVETAVATEDPESWKLVFELSQAAWILGKRLELDLAKTDARLILIDAKRDKALKRASTQQGVKLLYLDRKEIERVAGLEKSADGEITEVARKLLRLPLAGGNASNASSEVIDGGDNDPG